MTQNTKEIVVLLHGIMRGRMDMAPLSFYLQFHGYQTINIKYPARKMRLKELAKDLDTRIKRHKNYDADATIHFVTHSLGGLLARYYIRDFCPANLGRVVMLGPPNAGSAWADYMLKTSYLKPVFRFGFGPVGEQLLTTHVHDDDCNASDYELGIIAGTKNAVPFAKHILSGDHDGMVTVDATKMHNMRDHIVMHVTHMLMIVSPAVMRQVLSFLRTGAFEK
jgi:pimeloyl-ACP methyl ester carboxylesterase